MAKDYIEDKSGAKFPLNYTFDGVNNFVFSTDVMFEDLQALCLGLVAKLEAAQQTYALDGATCPAHGIKLVDGYCPSLTCIYSPPRK